MNTAYLLTGGNMGDKKAFLANAKQKIEETCGHISQTSSLYETAPWGVKEQDSFLNQVLKLKTSLEAGTLLQKLLGIEESLGRKRELKFGPRIIDIDILLFNDDVIKEENLVVPHPQLQNRRFVLVPLAEIAPHKIHPTLKKDITQLLAECEDKLDVQKIT